MASQPIKDFVEHTWRSPDGLEIYFRDYAGAAGEARLPVICLHGLTRNSQDFEEIAAAIARSGRRVIVPDMRGRGRSAYDPDSMHYVPKIYARDVIGLLKALGIGRAHFLGTSMGGIISMVVASLHGSMVAGAILNDIGPEAAPEGLKRIGAYAGQPIEIATWADATAYVERINKAAFPDADRATWERFARRTFTKDEDGPPRLDYDARIREPILAGKLKVPRFLAWLLFRRLARRRPLLVLRGVLSDILTPPIVEQMKKRAPHMILCEVPRVGHAPLLSEPEAERAILSFLDALA